MSNKLCINNAYCGHATSSSYFMNIESMHKVGVLPSQPDYGCLWLDLSGLAHECNLVLVLPEVSSFL